MVAIRKLIEEAIALCGSETALARAAGVSQPTVNEAKHKGRVSPRVALGIDRATGGQIPKSALRPDFWPPHREAAE